MIRILVVEKVEVAVEALQEEQDEVDVPEVKVSDQSTRKWRDS